MQVFPSKKDLWLGLIVWGSLFFGLVVSFIAKSWLAVILLIASTILVSWIWFNTNYSISKKVLLIICGPFSYSIPYEEIKSVRRTRSPLASCALSLDRLEIKHKKGITYISPQKADAFLKQLKKKTSFDLL